MRRPTEENQMNPKLSFRGAAIAAVVLAAAAPRASAASAVNRVASVEVDGPRVVVHGTAKPDYTVFKLDQPARLVVDLASADVTQASAPAAVHKDGIAGVSVAQFDEGESRVGRVVVALDGDAAYDVVARGNDLVVTISAPSPRPAAVQRAAASATPPDPNLVAVREDAIEVANPAQRLRAVSLAGDEEEVVVRLETDGQVAKFVVTELRNPGRLALDLRGMKSGARHATEGAGPVKGVRVARRDDGVRVVLDSEAEAMPKYDVQRSAAGLVVRVGDGKLAKAAPSSPASPREAEALPVAPQLATVKAVDLRTDEGKTRVVVAVDHPVKFDVSRPDPTTAVLTLHGAALPERLERNLDATAL
jgi:type IV pilus assembly protein PilQ